MSLEQEIPSDTSVPVRNRVDLYPIIMESVDDWVNYLPSKEEITK